ncbi:MAG: glycosyltransferase [Bryobacteraceae bacterium]
MAKIVLNTFGSFGDLHPFLALALELKRRGHRPVVATSAVYRAKILGESLDFHPVRPEVGEFLDKPDLMEKLWDGRRATQFLIRDYLAPRVGESFTDLRAGCGDADLLLTHSAGFGGPIVAELLRLPWLSVVLQPAALFSATDPPYVPEAPWLRHFFRLSPLVFKGLMRLADRHVRKALRPILELRKSLGLSNRTNPITQGPFSPYGTLALFSEAFAKPQADWPPRATQTGFVFYDRLGQGFALHNESGMKSGEGRLSKFLGRGDPPILFTLGSSAVMHAGDFYAESLRAAQDLGRRAVLLVGQSNRKTLPASLPNSIHVAEYLPFSKVMPRAAAIVHQGGIGTVAQSLRAGRPMLVVPWAHDQPDNAQRIRRIGAGRSIKRNRYNARTAAEQLDQLLTDRSYDANARKASEIIATENGVTRACDAIEAVLR